MKTPGHHALEVIGPKAIGPDTTNGTPAETGGRQSHDGLEQHVAELEQQVAGLSAKNAELVRANQELAGTQRQLQAMLDKGAVLGAGGVTHGDPEMKLAQQALRQSDEWLREVLRSTRCILNSGEAEAPEGWRERVMNELTIFRWNFPVLNLEAAQEVFPLDVPPDSTYQQVWSNSRHPDDFNEMHRVTRDAFLHDKPFYRNVFRCTDKHGIEHWMQEFITIHKLGENRWHLFGINTDITELKKSENALRSSEEKLRQFTAQLERSNRELQDFAYVASHDLQEPLRKIVVFGERLKEKNADNLTPNRWIIWTGCRKRRHGCRP